MKHNNIHTLVRQMQAAYAAGLRDGSEACMKWLGNALSGPGLLPPKGADPQWYASDAWPPHERYTPFANATTDDGREPGDTRVDLRCAEAQALTRHPPGRVGGVFEQGARDMERDWPVGTRVHLREDDGRVTETVTRSKPWQLGHGRWVVLVEGKSGGYLQDRMTPVEVTQ